MSKDSGFESNQNPSAEKRPNKARDAAHDDEGLGARERPQVADAPEDMFIGTAQFVRSLRARGFFVVRQSSSAMWLRRESRAPQELMIDTTTDVPKDIAARILSEVEDVDKDDSSNLRRISASRNPKERSSQ